MQKRTFYFVLAALFFLIAAPFSHGKSWRKITPMHSTRRDVAKIWKECEKAVTRCQFMVEGQEVMVIFSGSDIGLLDCEEVPKQTVLAITIRFKAPKKLHEFKVENSRFKTFDPSSPTGAGYKTYFDMKDGFMVNTFQGQVIGLVYIATEKDTHLCPEYYEDPKAFVEVGLVP